MKKQLLWSVIALSAISGSPAYAELPATALPGDTLPALCSQIYGSSAYYLKVARHNRLFSFRSLSAGHQIHFPPLTELL